MAGPEAVLYVRDLAAMALFYERSLGCTRGVGSDEFCELESGGWTLWLVRSRRASAAARSDPRGRRSDAPVKLCFSVVGLDASRIDVEAAGGTVNAGEWEFAGTRRTDAVDPEGNILQLVQTMTVPGT